MCTPSLVSNATSSPLLAVPCSRVQIMLAPTMVPAGRIPGPAPNFLSLSHIPEVSVQLTFPFLSLSEDHDGIFMLKNSSTIFLSLGCRYLAFPRAPNNHPWALFPPPHPHIRCIVTDAILCPTFRSLQADLLALCVLRGPGSRDLVSRVVAAVETLSGG
jgi:hypothetical protein